MSYEININLSSKKVFSANEFKDIQKDIYAMNIGKVIAAKEDCEPESYKDIGIDPFDGLWGFTGLTFKELIKKSPKILKLSKDDIELSHQKKILFSAMIEIHDYQVFQDYVFFLTAAAVLLNGIAGNAMIKNTVDGKELHAIWDEVDNHRPSNTIEKDSYDYMSRDELIENVLEYDPDYSVTDETSDDELREFLRQH